MSKFKIEIELDIDFQKFFDDIEDGIYDKTNKTPVHEYYEKEAVCKILHDTHATALMNHMNWMVKENKDLYKAAKHHLLIDEEIAKQIANNFKIIEYTKE